MRKLDDPSILSPPPDGNGKLHGVNGAAEPFPQTRLTQLSMSELHEELAKIRGAIEEAESHGADGESFKSELHVLRAEIYRELERRWEPAPSVQKTYPAEIEFPDSACTGLFRDWRDVVAPCTEA